MSDDEIADELALWSPTFERSAQAAPSPPAPVAKRIRLLRTDRSRQVARTASQSALQFPPLQLHADISPTANQRLQSPPGIGAGLNVGPTDVQALQAHGSQPLIDFQPHEVEAMWSDLAQHSSSAQLEETAVSRAEAAQQAWKARRPTLEAAAISSHACPALETKCRCQQPAVLTCLDCPGSPSIPLCADCDMRHHPHAHFHRRQHFCKQFWEPLPPSCNVGPDGHLQAAGRGVQSCVSVCGCGASSWGSPEPDMSESGHIIYIFQGRHEFCRYMYKCTVCGAQHRQTSADIQAVGAWPGTPDDRACVVFIDVRTFQDFRSFKFNNPQGSMQAFLSMLTDMTERWGSEVSSRWLLMVKSMPQSYNLDPVETRHDPLSMLQAPRIDNHMFIQSYLEWLRMENRLRQDCMLVRDLQCPACYPSPHSIHIDANMKLSVWKRSNAANLERTFPNVLLDDSEQVLEFMDALYEATGRGSQDRDCRVIWQAAGDKTHRYDKMAISGRCFGTCRHVMPMKAVSLVGTGERYAYAMFLLVHHFYAMAPKFIFQDIACKHSAWRSRLQQRIAAMPDEERQASPAYQAVILAMAHAALTTDVLPDMHGCLHAWSCQVQFGAGWKEGVAGGSGEDCEQFFSFASRLAYAQRNMGVARSDDFLTSACLCWAIRKRKNLAHALAVRFKSTVAKLNRAREQLRELCTLHLPRSSDLGASEIPLLHSALEQLAAEIVESKQRRRAGHVIEYFKLHQRVADAESLQGFVTGADMAKRIVAADNDDLVFMHRTASQLFGQIASLKASLEQARRKMIAEQPNLASLEPDQLANKSYQDLAEHHILQLQDQLEAQVAMLRRHRQKLLQEAGTPKARDRFNKKIRADNKSIEATVQQYNELVPWGARDRAEAQIAAFTAMPPQFPWADEAASGSSADLRPHGVYVAFGLCDARNRMRRCEEEVSLLRKEMNQYLAYFSDSLEQVDKEISTRISTDVSSAEGHGRLALLRHSAHLQRSMLDKGRQQFGPMLTNMPSVSMAMMDAHVPALVPSAEDAE